MRFLLTGLAALALAGCHTAAPDNGSAAGGAQPNEAAIENQYASQQAALAASIERDANDEDSNDDADDGPTAYSCDNNVAVTVAYADDGTASLTSGGKTVALKAVPAASGAKYHADTGLAPDKSLTWWSKGGSALLIQGPKGAGEGVGETRVNCLATDPDQ